MTTVTLPVAERLDEIVDTVNHNRVTIITSETGSGKTTLVPPALAEVGYRVTVTVPRRVAARSACTWVADMIGSVVGDKVGYQTAEERFRTPATKIIYCTDRLELIRRTNGHVRRGKHVLIVDEVHEWNGPQEVLVAWVRSELDNDPELKVVFMSASMDAPGLSVFFDNAPIIDILGRNFEIEEHLTAERPSVVIARHVKQGRNVLVFAAGKYEMDTIIDATRELLGDQAVILPFHGEQTAEEQKLVFLDYDLPLVVVATNVAETSLTIDCIDVVVDTGLAKRSEMRGSVKGLYTVPISQAEITQRKGRCGRTGYGIYELCSDMPVAERPLFPIPEILRVPLEELFLGLAAANIDASVLRFFHQPEADEITQAKLVLRSLGAYDSDDKITPIGLTMSRLPIDVHLARMVVEAQERGVLNAMLTIVSCLEVGGVRGRGKKLKDGRRMPPAWRRKTKERTSDFLAEMAWFNKASRMSTAEMYANDIHVKHFNKADELRARLARVLDAPLDRYTGGSHRDIVRACIPGMAERVYHRVTPGYYRGSDGELRRIERISVVDKAEWIIGIPFDLGSSHGDVVHMVTAASKVERAWIEGLLPQPQVQGRLALARALAESRIFYHEQAANQEVVEWAQRLHQRFPDQVVEPTVDAMTKVYAKLLGPVVDLDDLATVDMRLFRRHVAPKHLLRWQGAERQAHLIGISA